MYQITLSKSIGLLTLIQFTIQYDNSKCATLPTFMGASKGLGRIVNGKDAEKPIPWQIRLYYRGKARCGATLIDQTTILTAAHCCEFEFPDGRITVLKDGSHRLDFEPDRYSFKVGSLISFLNESYPNDHIRPYKIIIHPDFIHQNYTNDIAIIKLQ